MFYWRTRRTRLSKYYGLLTLVSVSIILLLWLFSSPLLCISWSPLQFSHHCEQVVQSFDLLRHLGGNGPWIRSHGHLALLTKLKSGTQPLKGSLAFLKTWSYFVDDQNPEFENLTTSGPYSGTLEAYTSGIKMAKQYNHLHGFGQNTSFWSCSSPRDIETAKHFARGFFGEQWEKDESATLHIIPETAERGGNTLTPGDTCLRCIEDKTHGHDQGYAELAIWQSVYTSPIISRLRHDAGNLDLTPLEIYSMMELCGFELLVRGHSPWCNVFTPKEWYDFEYGRDLLHFYRAGPGNQYAGAMGYLWLNATKTLLSNTSEKGLYLSFAHDGDIIPLIAAMGLLDEHSEIQSLPNDRNKKSRRWRTSDIVPMGGRVVFERVVCGDHNDEEGMTISNKQPPRYYVRLIINDSLFDLEDIVGASGLHSSTELASFQRWVDGKGQMYGDFRKVCGLAEDVPDHITFLHQ